MLLPKKVKHRKWHKLRSSGLRPATTKLTLSFGEYGLKALTPAWVSSRQIEAARRTMSRSIKRGGKIWIRIFPDKPVTTKGLEVPMGGGKGAVDHYVAIVRAGTMIFEMGGVTEEVAREAMRLASHKMPFRSRFVSKHGA
jgi:large subunit ribosomal protein L16